ncbi:MAG: HEAT repeat domain-containing protein, partial [Planctomycetes bacterium]|nr:HEAT repeat domain-containing protein [Planctomycetota bacterium]
DGPYVLLTPGSFNEEGGYRDQGDKTKFYTGDVPDGYVLDEGDLLVAMTEQAPGLLGSSAWIPEAARFLRDPEPDIALEAARAVHDVPIEAALPRLATLPLGPATPAAVSLRVLNARFRLGGGEEARAVAAAAADGGLAEEVRLEALSMLAAWAAPSGRDRVLGLWRPISARPGAQAAGALRGILPGLLRRAPEPLRAAAVEAAAALGLEDATPLLQELASDAVAPPGLRASSLAALERLGDPRLADAARSALRDPEPEVRLEGQRLLARVRPAEALPFLERALEDGSPLERQAACQALGGLEDPRADSVLGRWLKRLREGSVPLEVQLDLLEAAAQRGALRDEVAAYGASRSPESAAAIPAASPIARYRDCLAGGSAVRGRSVFFQKREVECQRCHKAGRNGGDVGPDLAGIGTRETREHILESIVAPNAKIAKGFETAALVTKDGKVVVGVLKAEDESALQVVTAEGALLVVPKDEVGERSSAVSAMPEDLVKHLTRRELRDLVEYLAGLQ